MRSMLEGVFVFDHLAGGFLLNSLPLRNLVGSSFGIMNESLTDARFPAQSGLGGICLLDMY